MRGIVVNSDRGLEAQLNAALNEIEQRFAQLEAFLFAKGQVVKGVTLPVGASTSIEHKLGRAYKGWFPVRVYRGAMTTWLLSEGNSQRPAEAVTLVNGCDANITIDLFVY